MVLERIEKLCLERGVTLTKMAEEAGLGLGTVTGWRGGSAPRPASLKKVADYFGVSVDFILNGNEAKNYASNIHNSNVAQGVNGHVIQGGRTGGLRIRVAQDSDAAGWFEPMDNDGDDGFELSRQQVDMIVLFNGLNERDQTRLLEVSDIFSKLNVRDQTRLLSLALELQGDGEAGK